MDLPGAINNFLRRFGLRLSRSALDPSLTSAEQAAVAAASPYSMTSPERLLAFWDAVQYAIRYNIPGSIVECGVWRGGSMIAAILALLDKGVTDRDLYLFDTYEGMPPAATLDRDRTGVPAFERIQTEKGNPSGVLAYASLEEVRGNITKLGYPMERIHFVKGRVEETIPANAPRSIAVLRLDTDWHDSTKHELEQLVPRLSPNGVLILDDYGHWEGARKAVDDWLDVFPRPVLLGRIDYTGRIAIIPA